MLTLDQTLEEKFGIIVGDIRRYDHSIDVLDNTAHYIKLNPAQTFWQGVGNFLLGFGGVIYVGSSGVILVENTSRLLTDRPLLKTNDRFAPKTPFLVSTAGLRRLRAARRTQLAKARRFSASTPRTYRRKTLLKAGISLR